MKKLATLLAMTIASTALLGGCDGATGPTTVVKYDTIHDTLYRNDRLAGSAVILHGQWRFTTPTDTGIANIFQIDDSISTTIVWKYNGVKSLRGKVTFGKILDLSDSSSNYQITGKLTDSSNARITRITGSVIDILKWKSQQGNIQDSIWAVRTF